MDTRLPQFGERSNDAGDWRSQLLPDSRQRIVNKITDTLKRHLPTSSEEIVKISVRFEEKIYNTATSQLDYLRKISLKMVTMETTSQKGMANSSQSNSAGSFGGQTQVPNQGQSLSGQLSANQSQSLSGERSNDARDWRSQLLPDSRQRIVNKITDTLKMHLPFSGEEGLRELVKIAVRFEEKIYTAATSQSDYLRKISLKMLTMDTKSQNGLANASQSNSAGYFGGQTQVSNQGQAPQQLLLQNIQNSIPRAGVQSSAGLPSALPPASGLMDTHNEWPPQGAEPSMYTDDWRRELMPSSRQRITNKIIDTLKRHLPYGGEEGLDELRRLAERFEERSFAAASSQSDYLRKISLKMLSFESQSKASPSNLKRRRVYP